LEQRQREHPVRVNNRPETPLRRELAAATGPLPSWRPGRSCDRLVRHAHDIGGGSSQISIGFTW